MAVQEYLCPKCLHGPLGDTQVEELRLLAQALSAWQGVRKVPLRYFCTACAYAGNEALVYEPATGSAWSEVRPVGNH